MKIQRSVSKIWNVLDLAILAQNGRNSMSHTLKHQSWKYQFSRDEKHQFWEQEGRKTIVKGFKSEVLRKQKLDYS